MGVEIPHANEQFRGKAAHCKVQRLFAISCAKTAEPTEMLFGLWTVVGARRRVLDGVHIGPTWRIRLNCPCVAVMRPLVKLRRLSTHTPHVLSLAIDHRLVLLYHVTDIARQRRRFHVTLNDKTHE